MNLKRITAVIGVILLLNATACVDSRTIKESPKVETKKEMPMVEQDSTLNILEGEFKVYLMSNGKYVVAKNEDVAKRYAGMSELWHYSTLREAIEDANKSNTPKPEVKPEVKVVKQIK